MLDRGETVFATGAPLSFAGYCIADVAIHALRGDSRRLSQATRGRAGRLARPRGATTATSTPTSPRSATNPNSKPSSPTSSATWRSSAPASPRARRMRRSN